MKKTKKESVMGKLANGDTDPMEPWSKKHAPLDEVNTQILWKYIKAMGRDPRTIPLADRLNLARTDRFKKFSRDHAKYDDLGMKEDAINEMDNRTSSGDRREQRNNSPEAIAQREKKQQERLKSLSPEMRKKLRLPEPKESVAEEIEQIDEISSQTKSSYVQKAKAQVKELQPHAKKGEYKDLAKNLIARRKKGIAMASEETVNEAGTGLLMSFIKAKGLDPRSMDGNQKNKYSKSSEYKTFKHRRVEASGMGERGEDWNEEKKPVKEAVDAKDTVTMDIPLLIRVLEYAREDAKTDMDLHKVVENLINMRKDTLTMNDYDSIVSIKEEVQIEEAFDGSKVRIHSPGHEMHGKIGRVFDRHEDGRVNAQFEIGPKKHQVRNYTLKPGQFKEVTNESLADDMIAHLRSKGLPAKKPMSKADSDAFLKARAEKFKRENPPRQPEPYKEKYPLGGRDERSGRSYSEETEHITELKKQPDNQDADAHITREDLRKWFDPKHPEGGWKRINSKGEAIGPCAREPGEPKPKCMSNEKRAKLSKKERASAVAAKRKHDPVADRPSKGGKPVNVSNFGKGKISEEETNEACWDTHKQVGLKKKGGKMVPNCVPKNEEVEMIDEKNSPTNPKLWARAKSLARSKFDVYPSAYANGWASKWYKSKGGGWKATKEEVEIEEQRTSNDPRKSGTFEKQPDGSFKRVSNLDKLKRRLMQKHGDKLKKKINEGIYGIEDSPMSATNSVKAMESRMAKEKSKSARIIKAIYRKKGIKETLYDWEKSEKGGSKEADAKIIIKGGKTMTGQERDTVEIDPVLKTKLNSPNGRPN
jgi:hypothetical protein